jgi:energy-coupling factor transporter ATP-binding protein EcfA2
MSPMRMWTEQDELQYHANIGSIAPRIPWDVFVLNYLKWQRGEHYALIGPTGQGKTTMMMHLLPQHPYTAVIATKPQDVMLDALTQMGYQRYPTWRSLSVEHVPNRLIWPDISQIRQLDKQRNEIRKALHAIYQEGGWTCVIDELWYIVQMLRLELEVKMLLLQGRSLGISMLMATQRPAFVPLEVYDQSTHLMFWRDTDETNTRRLSGITPTVNATTVRRIISRLEMHQVLYVNTRMGFMCRTRVPAPNIKRRKSA